MNPGVMLDITKIPAQMAGLASVSRAIAIALLAFIIPYTALEMNVRAMQSKSPPDYGGFLVRVVVAMACLLCYGTLYSFLLGASQAMSFAILSEEKWGDFLVRSFHGMATGVPTLNFLVRPISSLQEIILFLSSLVVVTARDVIVMLQACLLSLLFAFGPIAIVCGISERTASVTRGWIANSFQVALWSFFLRLVVAVWLTLNLAAGNTGAGNANDFLGILTVNVSFFVMALGTPILASRLISGESIAAFGEASMAAMQTMTIVAAMKGGRFFNRELKDYRRDKPDSRSSMLHHPVPATATWGYDKLFGRKPTPAAGNGKEKQRPHDRA